MFLHGIGNYAIPLTSLIAIILLNMSKLELLFFFFVFLSPKIDIAPAAKDAVSQGFVWAYFD